MLDGDNLQLIPAEAPMESKHLQVEGKVKSSS